uniref:FA_desaturase domain-containing protein n=1 Tax=Elaeophora elaphi TaxID=1147741 RepID=A0A0R3RPJ2_9BILA
MVSRTETAVREATADKGMDETDLETMKIVKEQFLAVEAAEVKEISERSKQIKFKTHIVWRNVMLFAALHVASLVGLYQFIFLAKWPTLLWYCICWLMGVMGITAGAHRLWSHRSYKAKWPARLFLMFCNSMAFQASIPLHNIFFAFSLTNARISLNNDVIEWARDHRCHHKWTDTDADPHNTTRQGFSVSFFHHINDRGMFFAHMGWLMVRKHPEVKRKGAQLDLSDLFNDPILAFQRRHYLKLVLFAWFVVPTFVPVYFWGESFKIAVYTCTLLRYCTTLHGTWLINSLAHKYGFKPYNPNITPVDSFVLAVSAMGEGGHNYHHTFPQDYRTSEYVLHFNVTKIFIDILFFLGLAYDMKVVPQKIIERQKAKYAVKCD